MKSTAKVIKVSNYPDKFKKNIFKGTAVPSLIRAVIYLIAVCLIFCTTLPVHALDTHNEYRQVLMITSFHMTHNWTQKLGSTIMAETKKVFPLIEFTIVELDAIRTQNLTNHDDTFSRILPAIAEHRYSAIVTLDDIALNCLLQHYDEIPKDIPIVFAGYESYTPQLKKKYPNLTGVLQNCDIEKTIRTGLAFYPDTDTFFLVTSPEPCGKLLENSAKQIVKKFPGVKLLTFDNRQNMIKSFFDEISKLPPTTLLIVSSRLGLYDRNYQGMESFGFDLAKFAKRPFLVTSNALIGYGALGGYGAIAEHDGSEAAELLIEALEQKSAVNIPVKNGKAFPLFDQSVVREYGLDESVLPADAFLINEIPNFWSSNKHMLFHILFLIIFVAGGFAAYFFAIHRSLKRHLKIYDALPGRICVFNRKEEILFMNAGIITDNNAQKVNALNELICVDTKKVSQALHSVFETGMPITIDYESNGTKRSVSLALLPPKLFGEEAVITFSHDNSELQDARMAAEEFAAKLKRSTKLWDIVINSIPMHVFAKNPDDGYKYMFCNKAMAEFNNITPDEILGKDDSSFFAQEDRARISEQDKAIINGTTTKFEQIIEHNDKYGGKHYFNSIKRAFVDDTGERLLLGAALDITDMNNLMNEQALLNSCLRTLIQENNLQTRLDIVMRAICQHFSASRIFIMRFDYKKQAITGFAEYVEIGKSSLFKDLQTQEQPVSLEYLQQLLKQNDFFIDDFQKDQNNKLKFAWISPEKQQKFRSVYLKNLLINNQTWGYACLVFEDNFRKLDLHEIELMNAIVHFIELSIERDSNRQNLIKALDETRKTNHEKTLLLESEKTINYCLAALFGEEEPMASINSVLEALANHFKATRCFILRIDLDNQQQWCFAEYKQPQEKESLGSDRIYPLNMSAGWLKHLLTHDTLMMSDLQSPEQQNMAKDWVDIINKFNIRSNYVARIMFNGKLWGCLGVLYQNASHDVDQKLSPELLESAAHMIAIVLQRQYVHDRLVDAMKQAQAANKAKGFFLASVSHELRTPLNAVIGFAELLKTGKVSPDQAKEYLESISFSGNALLQLINDVLDLSKLENNQMKIQTEPVDFATLGAEVMRVFAQRADEHNISLVVDIPKLPVLELDKMRIRQILFNFIGNAVKFTNHGSVRLWAEFQPGEEGFGAFKFAVTDTGIGMSVKDQQKIMEPFVQLSKMRGTNAANNGTGLGLPISKRLAEKMGGSIWLESEEGKGSTFGITLPKVAVSSTVAIAPENAETGGSKPKTVSDNKEASVLVVDDVLMNLKVMKAMLNKAGISNVTIVDSGKAALEAFSQRHFDLVLTDMWMPEMNGAELAAKLKSDEASAQTPIIAVTADVGATDNFDMKMFNGIIFKPVTIGKIREVLREHIS